MLAEFIKLPKDGDTIGPYLLQERLSTSILGSFFKATNNKLQTEDLIHIIPEALQRADPNFFNNYSAQIAAHKNFPVGPAMAAVDIFRADGNIVVRYEGGNYKSFNDLVLKQKKPIPEKDVRQYLLSIAKGLEAVQKLNQGHYFMTPDFLFLDEQGEVHIAGLGLFQSIKHESFERYVSGTLIPITIDKSKSFTALEILSPEIRNFNTLDPRSDFFCIGMCAYFLLTGKKPERRWVLPSKLRDDVGPGWDLFLSSCLEPRPVDRFPNYRAFCRDLENLEDLMRAPKREGGRLMRVLNVIPLPGVLESALGTRSLMILRLTLLILFGIVTVGTGAMLRNILLSDLGNENTRRIIKQQQEVEQANIILDIQPRRALVQVQGKEEGRFLVQNGRLMLRGAGGRYTFTVTAPHRRMRIMELVLKGSEPVQRSVKLSYNFASVHISGVVGTSVYVRNEKNLLLYLGEIESKTGLQLENRLLAGTYDFVARHDHYKEAILDSVEVLQATTPLAFDQHARPTSLIVTSSPTGANVYINDRMLGVTPIEIEGFAIGVPISLRVEKPGHREYIRQLEFSIGQSLSLDTGEMPLKEGILVYELDLSMEDPPDLRELTLLMDGQLKKIEKAGGAILPAGQHTISLKHPDYYPFEAEILIEDQKSTSLTFTLEPRPVRLMPQLDTDNPVRYLVDGEETPLNEQGYLPLPVNRPVTVEAAIRDYLTVSQTFQGRTHERISWDIPLRPIPGPEMEADWKLPYFDISMHWLDPGQYEMGSPIHENRRIPNEDNLTHVSLLSGFWMARYEITQEVYFRVMRANPSHFKGDNLPVDSVSWDQAMEFCKRLTEFERRAGRLPDGFVYRLPTEAEWEYAARAGTDTPFSFGSNADPSKGNFQGTYSPDQTVGDSSEDRYGSLPVGSFPPNPWGLHDVHGNVAEWTLDRFWDRHPGGSVTDPYNDDRGRGHALRGGSWEDSAYRVRSAAREGIPASSRRNSVGFRIVLARERS